MSGGIAETINGLKKKIETTKTASIPWEDRPSGCSDIVWRSQRNPIIPRNLLPNSNSIFNSAVVRFGQGFAGVFRCDDRARNMQVHAGTSDDGIKWHIQPQRIKFKCNDKELANWEFGYDPRVCWLEDRYYITWCNGYHGPTIGMAYTYDFVDFHQLENAFLPFNRNGVLFPRKINGEYAMLSRPSDNGHTPFGDIFYSQSPNMIHWGRHRFVMGTTSGWQSTKIGAGPIPIETPQGWLLFYHGVLTSCNGFVYSFAAALLDLEQPWKVIRRNTNYLLSPQQNYECVGDVPNVAFPCAALYDKPSGKIAIYYGGADTVTCLAFCKIDEVLAFLKEDNCIK